MEQESTERDKDRHFSNVNEIHLLHNDENPIFVLVQSLCVCMCGTRCAVSLMWDPWLLQMLFMSFPLP